MHIIVHISWIIIFMISLSGAVENINSTLYNKYIKNRENIQSTIKTDDIYDNYDDTLLIVDYDTYIPREKSSILNFVFSPLFIVLLGFLNCAVFSCCLFKYYRFFIMPITLRKLKKQAKKKEKRMENRLASLAEEPSTSTKSKPSTSTKSKPSTSTKSKSSTSKKSKQLNTGLIDSIMTEKRHR